jgi:hypothetical protein
MLARVNRASRPVISLLRSVRPASQPPAAGRSPHRVLAAIAARARPLPAAPSFTGSLAVPVSWPA